MVIAVYGTSLPSAEMYSGCGALARFCFLLTQRVRSSTIFPGACPRTTAVVPRDQWESVFRAQGTKNPTPRVQMLDGFNAGWIDFPDRGAHARKGSISIDQAIATLIHGEHA
jgi:hypothetical protein